MTNTLCTNHINRDDYLRALLLYPSIQYNYRTILKNRIEKNTQYANHFDNSQRSTTKGGLSNG